MNSGDGIYKVLVGRRGLSADSHQTSLGTERTLNNVAPTLTVTHPAAGTVAVPMIQLQGHGSAASSRLTHDVRNATGIFTRQPGDWQPVFFNPNRLAFTTSFVNCARFFDSSRIKSSFPQALPRKAETQLLDSRIFLCIVRREGKNMIKEKLNTAQKALQINLDAKKYGTFAEIGAGQEVARWFFQVGKASGTVAKTISAYDMLVSDAIYGAADRYVSRKRLQSMLDLEFNLLVERLDKTRGDKCTFFAFADTVATRHISKPGEEGGQGWLGVKFQTVPQAEPSSIIIHVRLLDFETGRQQDAVGHLGVNLIHAAFYQNADPTSLIGSLLDGVTNQRIEVDMIKFSGPAFFRVDNRLMTLQLVEQWLTEAAMFTANGESVIPSELLWKKPVLLERGSFRPLTNPMLDMMERAQEMFVQEPALAGETPVTMFEMTLRQLQVGNSIDHQDFLDRVDTLGALGKPVLISNFLRYHRLLTYLSRHTQKPIGLPIGLVRLRDVLDEKFYTDLPGGLMESLGQLFKNGAKLYVYPSLDKKTGRLTTLENLEVAPHLRHLYTHLVENKFIENITSFNAASLKIYSGEVLAKIHSGDESLAQLIPPQIFELIRAKKLFGWQQKAVEVTA